MSPQLHVHTPSTHRASLAVESNTSCPPGLPKEEARIQALRLGVPRGKGVRHLGPQEGVGLGRRQGPSACRPREPPVIRAGTVVAETGLHCTVSPHTTASKAPASTRRHAGAHSAGSGKATERALAQGPPGTHPPATPSPLGAVIPLVSNLISGK